jgi:hypothetical protein
MQRAICSIRCPARTHGSATNRTRLLPLALWFFGDAGGHVLPLDRHKDEKLLQRHLAHSTRSTKGEGQQT